MTETNRIPLTKDKKVRSTYVRTLCYQDTYHNAKRVAAETEAEETA